MSKGCYSKNQSPLNGLAAEGICTLKKRVEIISKTLGYDKFFKIEEVKLRHEKYNGKMSDELLRLNFVRGDSAAALMHDAENDTLIFTEQFRYPTYEKGPGWMVEIPAGSIESEENVDPTRTLSREIMEEIGYSVSKFKKLCTFYVSPGGTSERIHLYYAQVSAKDKVSEGGGVLKEGEDIRIISIKVNEALKMIDDGRIQDSKSIIALQWLQLHRSI